jgi:hypothetical protein
MFAALALASVLAAAPQEPSAAPCEPELFRIGRSTNANEIVYAARTRAGSFDEDGPIDAYWVMRAEEGQREGMNFLERMLAYGFSVDPAPAGDGFTVLLKAKKDRPLHLTMRDGCPVALARIGGREALLRFIFVQTSSEEIVPSVAYVDVVGVDPATGDEVRERVVPQ